MDSNIIGQGFNNLHIDPFGREKLQKQQPVKPQEEFVTDWQLPIDKSNVTTPRQEKPKKHETKTTEDLTSKGTVINEGEAKIQEGGSILVQSPLIEGTVLFNDPLGNKISRGDGGQSDVPFRLFIEEPIQLPPPVDKIFVTDWQLPPPDGVKDIGKVKLAGPNTQFFTTGVNSVRSVVDGIFNVNGEMYCPPLV